MHLISLIYGVQYMDKSTCSFASIMGLLEVLSMHGQIYSWTTTSFNLAYLVFVFPLSRLLQRFPLVKNHFNVYYSLGYRALLSCRLQIICHIYIVSCFVRCVGICRDTRLCFAFSKMV